MGRVARTIAGGRVAIAIAKDWQHRAPVEQWVELVSGTSVTMIEKHYGHLVRDDAEEALASIAI